MSGKFIFVFFAWFLFFSGTSPLPAQAMTWNFLANKRIDRTRDHEKIEIRRRDTSFQAIQLRVTGNPIFFNRIIVHFGDGNSEELAVNGRVWPEGQAKVIALSSEPGFVESVEVWYYTEPWMNDPTVTLYGS